MKEKELETILTRHVIWFDRNRSERDRVKRFCQAVLRDLRRGGLEIQEPDIWLNDLPDELRRFIDEVERDEISEDAFDVLKGLQSILDRVKPIVPTAE